MPVSRRSHALFLAVLPLLSIACAQTRPASEAVVTTRPASPADVAAWAAIRDEGLNRSKVAETAEYLCSVIGPRLTGTPGVMRANEWTRDTLAAWGLAEARLEPWGPFGRGWEVDSFSMRVTEPHGFTPIAVPRAWSAGLDRPITAPVVYLDTKTEAGLEAYKDRVKGAIVLVGQPRTLPGKFEPQAARLTDERLKELANLPLNTKRSTLNLIQSASGPATDAAKSDPSRPTSGPAAVAELPPTTAPTTVAASATSTSSPATGPTTRRARRRPTTSPAGTTALAAASFGVKALAFAAKNGAALVVTPSTVGDGGTVFVTQALLHDTTPRKAPNGATTQPRVWWPDSEVFPQVMMAAEDFNRLVSLARHGMPTTASVDFRARYTPNMPQQYNTIAELPGTDLADQIVMCGGHIDSWHSGTGATDNAAGTVVAMEAIRIIKASGLRPRRTIRVALWGGEEQGLLGSSAYVRQTFGTLDTDPQNKPTTQPADPRPATTASTNPATEPSATAPLAVGNIPATKPTTLPAKVIKVGPAYDKFAAYFNLDNGTGRIRGIYGENNVGAIALFKQWVEPLKDLGATTVTTDTTGQTDHVAFNRVGLPGFQFIQDPIEYFPRTHHSNADTYDRLQIDDLKQASVVMATFLWNAANTDEPMPRKPLGK